MFPKKFFPHNRILFFFLGVVIFLSACAEGTTGDGGPVGGGLDSTTEYFLTDWNLHTGDPEINEVLLANQSQAARDLRASWDAQKGQLDLKIECCDGRQNPAWALGAKNIADGAPELRDFAFIESGMLAATVPDAPWTGDYLNWLIDSGYIRAIDVSPHTVLPECVGCGAQGVKYQLVSNPGALAEFESKGLGLTANWVNNNVISSDPAVQAIANAKRAWEMTGGRIEVTAWVFDHVKQVYLPVAQWEPGKGLVGWVLDPASGAVWDGVATLPTELQSARVQGLVVDNLFNAEVAAKSAAELGFNEMQGFRRIVVSDQLRSAETFLGDVWGPDAVFNIHIPVRPDASLAEFEAALDGAFAAGDYAMSHAGRETEIFGFFSDKLRAETFVRRLLSDQIARGFMSNHRMQEISVFLVDQNGLIVESMLIKPALMQVDELIWKVFRGMTIKAYDPDGGWAAVRAAEYVGEDSVWFRVGSNGIEWRRVNPAYPYQFIDALKAQARHLGLSEDLFWLDEAEDIIYMPDLGLPMINYFETNGWDSGKASEIVLRYTQQLEDMYPEVAMLADAGVKQIIYDPNSGMVSLSDFEMVVTGEAAVKAEYPTLQHYQKFLRRNLEGTWHWMVEDWGLQQYGFSPDLTWPDAPVGVEAAVDESQVQTDLPEWIGNPQFWVSLESTSDGTWMSVMSVVDNGSYQFFLPEGQAITADFLVALGIPVPQATALETALNNAGRMLGTAGKFLRPLLIPVGIGVIVVGTVYGGYLDYAQIVGLGPVVVQTYDSRDVIINDPAVAQVYSDLGLTATNAYKVQTGPSLHIVAENLRKRSEGCTKDPSYVLGVDEAGRFSLHSIGVVDRDITTPIVVGPHPDVPCQTDTFWPSAINYTNQVTGEIVTWYWDGVASWYRTDGDSCMTYTAPVLSGTGTWPFPFKLCWAGVQEQTGPDVSGIQWP